MRMHRRLTVFVAAFAVLMIGGAALAAVTTISPGPEGPTVGTPAFIAAPAGSLGTKAISPSTGSTASDPQPTGAVLVVEPLDDVAPTHRFTAHQRYEVVDGDPAVNGYWGTSKPGSIVTIVSRFGEGRTETGPEDHWELKVEFPTAPCNEWFKVVASSGDHQQTLEMKRACRDEIEFTAHQQYGECSETVPYDVFRGTAIPGSEITVESPHGHGTTTANDDGHWEIKVEFQEAPEGKVFEVVVESADGGRAQFTFVNIGTDEK